MTQTKICAGIDAGSRAIKIVLFDPGERRVIACGSADQGVEQGQLAIDLLDGLLAEAGLTRSDLGRVVATGYGRNRIGLAETTVTEITCHARGVRHQAPEARTIIEIGGQDSKVIRLGPGGAVRDFMMNDRCAAGTGRFLEMVATRLGTQVDALGALAEASRSPATISSMCVVFAETEIIGLLADGVAPTDIVAGVQGAIVARVLAMLGQRIEEPVVFTGGVARVSGMAAMFERKLERPVAIVAEPHMTGALGAALMAMAGPNGKNFLE